MLNIAGRGGAVIKLTSIKRNAFLHLILLVGLGCNKNNIN
jgi:hypothetical protein